ncbi:MAG TPA: beta-L-arabinofuranosidase domain-containing protein [Roseiflexaceae bacterium]|nr:beta-L-arabinofuranosidase domain-containing protein [Roseiflexaceae bacterium]
MATTTASASSARTVQRQYMPIPFTRVTINDTFWAERQRINREQTIPHIYKMCEETDRIAAFRPDWTTDPDIKRRSIPILFWDSDVAKWLEAASYSLATNPDPDLDTLVDEVIALVAQAQQPDGYLNNWFTKVEPEKRWTNLRDWHELYNAGHLIEAGVAHFEATGKRSLLDVICRYADYINTVFGTEPGKRRGYPGHPEIELALVRLYRATGEQRYLDLSRYFVNERGRQPHYYDQEARERGEDPAVFWARSYEYNQSHLPVREQQQVVGHAVRAVYLYSAMVDLAIEDGDASLMEACERLWPQLTTRRMYVMGGIGTSKSNEGFTSDYDLPNESAYAETCAAIGLVYWAHRMLQVDCNRTYTDILELALYNAVLSGVSLDGTHFFYDNPLASNGDHHRVEWFVCPCCPPNLARLFASLGEYLYAQSDDELVVHLYMQGEGQFEIGGQAVTLRQTTNYPWDGSVKIQLELNEPAEFGLRLRIPAWCTAPRLSVNGEAVDLAAITEQGYACVRRTWSSSDTIELELPMLVERVYANPNVKADVGSVALRRGPLVYCFEQVDQEAPVFQTLLPEQTELLDAHAPDLLEGVVQVTGSAIALDDADWEDTLYRTAPPTLHACTVQAIPYYAWDNREPGAMSVWLREPVCTPDGFPTQS